MSSPTKADVINDAYEEIRVSGLTVNPSPSDLVDALDRLEDMMSEFFTNWNMNLGYNFEDSPDINSVTNMTRNFSPLMKYCLAMRLIPAFNKTVPQRLEQLAASAFSAAQGINAAMNLRQVQPSRRMPKGSGNTLRNIYKTRFMQPVALPPSQASNNTIEEGETQNYEESFSAWLGLNTIASFTITADPRLTIVSSSSANDPVIDYTVTASTNSSYGPWQYVKITVTDSAGRVNIRLISFIITEVPTVPAP